jgi:hypothetical protein
MNIAQWGILLLGPTAVFLSQGSERARKWAPYVGLASQPFWVWSALSARQWGVLVVTIIYTAAWARGIWRKS